MSWNGLMKIIDFQQIRNGKIVLEKKNLNNMIHYEGDEYFLTSLFKNDGTFPAASYYLGLDSRTTIALVDSMSDLLDEPISHGYIRQAVSSQTGNDTGWNITFNESGYFKAMSSIVTFIASGGNWGPVKNLFLTNKSDNSGKLLSTVSLSSDVSLTDGDAINLRIAMTLRDFPI